MDLPTFGSPTLSRFSGQANQDKEEVRNDFQSSFRGSALSQELSTDNESTNLTSYDETETKGNSKEDSSSSEISKNGGHFHFSIYKWADKGGVPVAIPLRESDSLKKKDILQRCSSANGWIAGENIAMEPEAKLHNNFCFTNKMSSNAKSFRVEHGKNEHGEQGQIIKEDNIPKSQTENINNLKSNDKNVPDNTALHSSGGEEKIHYTLSRVDFPAVGKEIQRDNARVNDKMIRNVGTKDIYEKSDKKLSEILDVKSIKKQEVKKKATSNSEEAGTTSVKGSPRNSWENGKGRVRGKVKDFIKIFNQDASSKPRADTVSERYKERHAVKPENKPSMTERDDKIHLPDIQTKKSSPDVPVANHMSNGASDKNTNSLVNDTVSDGSKTILKDPAETFEDNLLIEDLMPEEKILLQFGNDPEEIQAIDAKIRQWSNGKQGNIRSLLSTLQYILWPDSGWKSVPLVDIIEGPAVKRSYQKALLCLHPDKLQQKGAASDQKYIAEKVFDILQDAWTHINSLGSV